MSVQTTSAYSSALPFPASTINRERKRKGSSQVLNTREPSADDWADALVSIAERQDRNAFARLFRHFAPRVKAYLMRSGAGESLADECTQEAFATVWRKAGLFRQERASAATWIFTIARNKHLDSLRKLNRPEPEELPWGLSEEPDPSAIVELADEQANLTRAIRKLPERQRQMIEKAFFGELSHSEIAETTGLPLGTIKSRIRLGLDRLRHELKTDKQ